MYLVGTAKASEATGISPFELIRGYKSGRLPAVMIGKGGRGSKLRWDVDLLTETIQREMMQDQQERLNATI